MGIMAIACYRPKPGKEAALKALMKTHLPALRSEGLVEDVASICGEAKDGTIVEAFVWKSEEAIASAHENPVVTQMWAEYEKVCEYVPFAAVAEAEELFSPLKHLELS